MDELRVFLLVCGLRTVKDPLYLVEAFSGILSNELYLSIHIQVVYITFLFSFLVFFFYKSICKWAIGQLLP